ncbi:MAG: S8 family serine peptidase [Bacteroidales bacterium]|nr:S8 family serine peptidase [Bacteroidales bacterium]
MMIRYIFFYAFLAVSLIETYAQPQGPAYVVKFANKNNSPYTINNPSAFLSPAALNRRLSQGIAIDPGDLPVTPSYIEAITQAGAQIAAVSRWFNTAAVWINNPAIIQTIEAMPFVVSVISMDSPGKSMTKQDWFNKLLFNEDEALAVPSGLTSKAVNANYYNYGDAYNQISMVSGHILHNQGFSGQGMVIAVLDAGFRRVDVNPVFDSLRLENRILGSRDFVQPGNNVYNPNIHTHGTNVLSIMAANISGQMVGTAPKASYWLLRTEDALAEYLMEEYYWVAGAEFADSVGAWVINSSLGYTTFDNPYQNHTYAHMNGNTAPSTRGGDIAASKGILVINSAGNSGLDSWYYIGAPADGDSVLAIGAVNASGIYATFSSKGPSSDGRVKPDVSAQGQGTTISNSLGTITSGSGTSFSSPVVAGVAACLWQTNLNRTNMQVAQSIKKSSSQYNNPDAFLGYGIPDFQLASLLLRKADDSVNDSKITTSVFPNPFNDFFWVSTFGLSNSILIVRISDATGKNMLVREASGQSNYLKVDGLSHLGSVLYIIHVTTSSGTATRKLLKF